MYNEKKHNILGIVITVIIIILIVIFSNNEGESSFIENLGNKIIMPIQSGFTFISNKMTGNDAFFADMETLKKENQEIKDKNKELEKSLKDVPSFEITEELSLIDFLVNYKIASSKREAREFINAGSITINGDKITDETKIISKDIDIEEKAIVVRRGKKKYYIGKFM